jgi:hypothetical protein
VIAVDDHREVAAAVEYVRAPQDGAFVEITRLTLAVPAGIDQVPRGGGVAALAAGNGQLAG